MSSVDIFVVNAELLFYLISLITLSICSGHLVLHVGRCSHWEKPHTLEWTHFLS